MIKCIAVEDEPLAMEKLKDFIGEVSTLDLVAFFDSSLAALNFLNTHPVDLIFLDIQMDKLNGIQLLQSLTHIPKVIIISAYSEYAIKGYEFKVSDYIMKPYSFDRLLLAINKAQEELSLRAQPKIIKDKLTSVFIKTAHQIEKVELDTLLYIQGMKDYLQLVCTSSKVMCLQNFKSMLAFLPESDFIRIHKSYIVALNKIESISNHRIKIGNELLPISKTYQEAFYKSLETHRKLL
ncbi:MAG: LytTR family DNA-binding domain-containing protein [Reichenbachiella sp.]